MFAIASCEKTQPSSTPSAGSAAPSSVQTYLMRGRIVSLPEAGKPMSQLAIHHEAVPDFVNKDGEKVGMDEMTMPFVPATGVSLVDLKAGDAVEFTLEMRWAPRNSSATLTKIRKLGADEPLHLKGE